MGAYVEEPVTLWDCMSNARAALKFLSYQTLETFSGCSARGEDVSLLYTSVDE